MNDSLALLEQRIANLEAQLAALRASISANQSVTRIVAPLEITDTNGQVLVVVDHQEKNARVCVYNKLGQVSATLEVDRTQAGLLTLRNADGIVVASLDVETSGARLILQNHVRKGGVVLFGGESGEDQGGGIHVLRTTDELSLSFWSERTGGRLVLYDAEGQEKLILPLEPSE